MAEFEHEDFDYDDLNEIKTFLELWKERFPDSWINNVRMIFKDITPTQIFKFSPSNIPSEMFSFKNWNDIRIVNYDCDDEDFVFFRCLAKYIRGAVTFKNCGAMNDVIVMIEFDDGCAYFNRGEMKWIKKEINSRTMKYKNRDRYKEIEAIVSMVKHKNGGQK